MSAVMIAAVAVAMVGHRLIRDEVRLHARTHERITASKKEGT